MAKEPLQQLFERYTGEKTASVEEISASGSHRRYFRLRGGDVSVIGVIGTDYDENRAFITLDRLFRVRGINVPEVYAVSEDGLCYIQEDLGDSILFNEISRGREIGEYSPEEEALLLKTIACLPKIQFEGGRGLDWNICYPQASFDARMVDFDLNYFKYCFLKATGLEFNEVRLQDDFERLRESLLEDVGDTFLYRDFQARNVMLRDGVPYFIDFQGGRRGPVEYDLASFLWNAGTHFSAPLRRELEADYLRALDAFRPVDTEAFYRRYRLITLVRLLQETGAYGFRGLVERKQLFLDCIPTVLRAFRELTAEPFARYPYLTEVLQRLAAEWDGRTILPGVEVAL
jgi:aminoglycoside/choline kinase family phosphotransferase